MIDYHNNREINTEIGLIVEMFELTNEEYRLNITTINGAGTGTCNSNTTINSRKIDYKILLSCFIFY